MSTFSDKSLNLQRGNTCTGLTGKYSEQNEIMYIYNTENLINLSDATKSPTARRHLRAVTSVRLHFRRKNTYMVITDAGFPLCY